MYFAQLKIHDSILKAINDLHYSDPTPIQVQAIPPLLDGSDLLGTAQTGTGKTAAYGIPLLQKILATRTPYQLPTLTGLIIAPTRELAAQIGTSLKEFGKYSKVRITVVFGGMAKGPQIHNLRSGTDILVATPGRLLDLADSKCVDLSTVNYFVLDEGDQMLDMGFIPDIKRIVAKLPRERQTMLFSATMPNEILSLANSLMHNPIRIAIGSVQKPLDAITQGVYRVAKENKADLLIHLLKNKDITSALVFCRTKNGSNRLTKKLLGQPYKTEVIHGNKSQNARTSALSSFKSHQSRVLIATDIAARGLDISQISHVFNYDMPQTPETYLHRMGRTGRAGEIGISISFCSNEELTLLKDVQKHIGMNIPLLTSPIGFAPKAASENPSASPVEQTNRNRPQPERKWQGTNVAQTQDKSSRYPQSKNHYFHSSEHKSPNAGSSRYGKVQYPSANKAKISK